MLFSGQLEYWQFLLKRQIFSMAMTTDWVYRALIKLVVVEREKKKGGVCSRIRA